MMTVSNCTISGNFALRAFGVSIGLLGGGIYNEGTMTLSNSTVSDNSADGYGGGINSSGTLMVSDCTLSDNSAVKGGGGLFSDGTLTVSNSTIYGNTSVDGGGILATGTIAVIDSTLAYNSAFQSGGGLADVSSGKVTLGNTIIADNWVGAGYGFVGPDIDAVVKSLGNNLISDEYGGHDFAPSDLLSQDPLLGPLQNNGGPTETMSLLPGSPAIDAGSNAVIPAGITTDQRGLERTVNGTVNIGALEDQLALNAPAPPGSVLAGVNTSFNLGSFTDAAAGVSSYTVDVNWGDGTPDTIITPSSPGSLGLTHTFLSSGPDTITVTVTDADSDSAQITLTVTVNPVTAASLQSTIGSLPAGTSTVTLQVNSNSDVSADLNAIDSLSSPSSPTTIVLNCAADTFSDQTASPPANVIVIVNANGASSTIVGNSPALTVAAPASGAPGTVVYNGFTMTTATNSPAILVTGGNLVLRKIGPGVDRLRATGHPGHGRHRGPWHRFQPRRKHDQCQRQRRAGLQRHDQPRAGPRRHVGGQWNSPLGSLPEFHVPG